jgi:hypothetical protein
MGLAVQHPCGLLDGQPGRNPREQKQESMLIFSHTFLLFKSREERDSEHTFFRMRGIWKIRRGGTWTVTDVFHGFGGATGVGFRR